MYHYRESGLRNVWLRNGYLEHQTSYGNGISIHDVRGLHQAIGRALIAKNGPLTGAEFRFLRGEMELSQAKLANLLGNDAQSIAIWEKRGRAPKWADRFIRALYREHSEGNAKILEIVERLADTNIDEGEPEKLTFEEAAGGGWMALAA